MIYLVKSYQFFHNYLSHIYTHTLGHLGVKEQPYILAGNAGYISQHPKLVFVANTSYPNSGHGAPALPRRRVPWPGPHQPGPSPRRAPRPRHRRARHPVRRRVGAPAHVPVLAAPDEEVHDADAGGGGISYVPYSDGYDEGFRLFASDGEAAWRHSETFGRVGREAFAGVVDRPPRARRPRRASCTRS